MRVYVIVGSPSPPSLNLGCWYHELPFKGRFLPLKGKAHHDPGLFHVSRTLTGHTHKRFHCWPVPTSSLFPAVRDPRVPTGAWFSREAEMCPPKLFLPSLSPQSYALAPSHRLRSGACCQSWGWMSPHLRASWTPFSRQHFILTLITGCD